MYKKSKLIIIDGPMGAGKTTIAEMLHDKIKEKTALVSLDKIKWMVSKNEMDSKFHLGIASEVGGIMANFYLKRGLNVIVEKAFTKNKFVRSFLKRIKGKPQVLIYQIEAPHEVRYTRIKEREKMKKKPHPKRKLKEKVARNSLHYHESKYGKAKIFDSSKLSTRKIVNEIIKDIK